MATGGSTSGNCMMPSSSVLPRKLFDRINAAVVKALHDPDVRDKLTKLGQEIPGSAGLTPDALAARQFEEIRTWKAILEAAQPQSH